MIDLTIEWTLSLEDACRIVPPARGGKKTHLSTILRWIARGCKGPGGARVRLEAVRLGGRWITSREALQRFAEALTPRPSGNEVPDAPRTLGQYRSVAAKAGRQLERMGV